MVVGSSDCVTIMDQPSTSSTNRSELVCRKYYLWLGLIAYLLSERSGAEVTASLDIVYCSLDRNTARASVLLKPALMGGGTHLNSITTN
ncbi:hypothetical protein J6590_044486 [Homalodisca vitripennis]|nr:hypothetical protein J6590_044486 [Homalodisca vitripennis]